MSDGWRMIAREGSIGEFSVTREMLESMVANFNAPIMVDREFDGSPVGWMRGVELREDEDGRAAVFGLVDAWFDGGLKYASVTVGPLYATAGHQHPTTSIVGASLTEKDAWK